MIEKEKADLSKKKKEDRDLVHGITRSFQVDEYVSQIRIDLHSQRAQEKRAKIAEMMRLYVVKPLHIYQLQNKMILNTHVFSVCHVYYQGERKERSSKRSQVACSCWR